MYLGLAQKDGEGDEVGAISVKFLVYSANPKDFL